MKRILSLILIHCLFSTQLYAAGKIQGADVKSLAELTAAGAGKAQLIDDSKIYVTAGGINDQLSTAITSGLIGGSCSSMISNGCFENGTTGWTNVNGVFSVTTTAGEFTEGKQAAKIALTAQALNFSQTITTTSGIQKQGVVGAAYKVPAAITDFQICTLVDAVEQTCVPSSNLIADGLYHSIEIPITFGSTSAGIKFKTTATYTQNVFFDATYIKQGIGYQNLMLDNVYSAQVTTTTGVVTNQNKSFISSCTAANPTVCTLTGFSVTPNCVATIAQVSSAAAFVSAASPTSISITSITTNTGASLANQAVNLTCQKSGNDYLAASAAVYSQASANYGLINFTPTSPNSSITISSSNCQQERVMGNLHILCNITSGAPASAEARLALPNSLVVSSKLTDKKNVGKYIRGNATSVAHGGSVYALAGNSYVTFSDYQTFGSASVDAGANALATTSFDSGVNNYIEAWIPIEGWSNSAQIVGSFAGYPSVPGYQGNVDTFSVSFSGSGTGSVCSTSPCTIDQIGTAVSTITRASAGNYTVNFSRTYSKLKCVFNQTAPGVGYGWEDVSLTCSSCSSLVFASAVYTTSPVNLDTKGTLICQGSY